MQIQRIILIGGCCLAFGAAFANTGFLLRTGISVSHLTGDISKLSIDAVLVSPGILLDLFRVTTATLSFFLGAFVAGMLIHHPTMDFARPYGRTVTGIGVLLVLAHFLIPRYPVCAIALSAFGCGLQNSLASRYHGVILRTTHLTGLITDFGNTLGMKLRGHEIASWKIAVPGLLTSAFVVGCVVSALLYLRTHWDPVFVAGCGYIVAGLLWTVTKHWILPRFSFWNEPGEA